MEFRFNGIAATTKKMTQSLNVSEILIFETISFQHSFYQLKLGAFNKIRNKKQLNYGIDRNSNVIFQ